MDLKETYKTICNKYAQKFAEKHEYSFDDWVDVGEVAMMGDFYVDFRDIKYDIDNNVDVDEYVKYYDYCLEVGMLNLSIPNYESWCKGCPRIPQDVIDKMRGLRRELDELIKETKRNYGKK